MLEVRRRQFITLLGGAAAAWPVAVHAQQPDRMRRIGVLGGFAENDPEMKARLAGFRQGIERLGWSQGRNLRIDYRFAPAGPPHSLSPRFCTFDAGRRQRAGPMKRSKKRYLLTAAYPLARSG